METTDLKRFGARVKSSSSCFSEENLNSICFSLGSFAAIYIWRNCILATGPIFRSP